MPITLPVVQQKPQNISVTAFTMGKYIENGLWEGVITFTITDDDGKFVSSNQVLIPKDKWNEFWANFNNGSYLYQQYTNSPETGHDADFINSKS